MNAVLLCSQPSTQKQNLPANLEFRVSNFSLSSEYMNLPTVELLSRY
jgi:hypothetical protein